MVLRLTFRLRMCRQIHLTQDFSRTLSPCAHTLTSWLKVYQCAFHSICMLSMRSHVWACIVCSRFVFFLSLEPPLALHWLPVLCRAHQLPQCRIRRGLNPVRTRTMRSVAPWRCTTLSQHDAQPRRPSLLAHLHEMYLFVKEYGLILNQELNPIKRSQWQKDKTLFFGMDKYTEKKMGRSNSGEWKMIFGTNLSTLSIGLMMCGRARWQEAEQQEKISILCWSVRTRNSLPSSSSRSFRTQSQWSNTAGQCVEYIYHIGCAVSVHSITNSGLKGGGQNSSRERQTIFLQPWIPWIKITEIRKSLIWPNHVLHRASKSGKAPGYGVLGRYTACSTERIEVLSNKM